MPLSQAALQAVLSSATSKVFLETLKLTHSQMSTIRIVNDNQDLVRADGTYIQFPFSVVAPTQTDDRAPIIQFTATMVDQQIIQELRKLAGLREKAIITYEAVLADTPDVVEFGPVEFEFDSLSTNGLESITVEASFMRGLFDDAFPALQFAPNNVGNG